MGDYPEITIADPTMEGFDKLDDFQRNAQSPQLDRFVTITEAVQETLDAVLC